MKRSSVDTSDCHSAACLVPQQLEPAPATPVDSGCEQCLADEVKQSACGIDRQQDA